MKIIVIGAGIIGASFAHHLTREGAQVVLLDKGRPGGATSGATAAHLNYFKKDPDAYARLHLDGIAYWKELTDAIGASQHLHMDGELFWADSGQGWDQLAQRQERALRFGQQARRLTLADLEPGLQPALPGAPYWVAGHGWVEVVPVIERLIAAARGRGLQAHFHTPATAIARDAAGRWQVRAGDQDFHADQVVLAVGPDSAELGELLGLRLPVVRKPGVIAVSAPVAVALPQIVFTPGFTFRTDGGGRVLMGLGQHYSPVSLQWTPETRTALTAQLQDKLAAWLPDARGVEIEALRIGVRPVPADGLPLVGPVPGHDGLYLAATHSGICLAPLLGQLAARELVGGRSEAVLDAYRPARLIG